MIKIKLILLVLFNLLYFVSSKPPAEKEHSWNSYKNEFHKNFTNSTEESVRKRIWQSNYDIIKKHNQETNQRLHSHFVGVNQFTDLSPQEFENKYLGLKFKKLPKTKRGGDHEDHSNENDDDYNNKNDTNQVNSGGHRTRSSTYTTRKPTTKPYSTTNQPFTSSTNQPTTSNNQPVSAGKDWRELGKVTPVKDQGACGSCWAFSAIATIESQYLIKKNMSVNLSEQNLVDCSSSYGNYGCNGGWPDSAYDYIIAKKGISSSTNYPYKARDQTCQANSNIAASISSYYSSGNSEAKMIQALDQIGPISVTLNANLLQYYSSGIINEASCSTRINHAVVAVGYGTENGIDYFICKNSWGSTWGENGYFRIARNKNMCGIATYFSYPIL